MKNYDDIRRPLLGRVQPNLNLSHIAAAAIPFPSLAEQHRIVAEVDRRLLLICELGAQVDASFNRFERLRQSNFAEAFSGLLLQEDGEKSTPKVRLVAKGR